MPDRLPHTAIALSKKGPRDYNEDRLFPADFNDRSSFIYMVCDGVGRSNRGELAAEQVCARFPRHYVDNDADRAARLEYALERTEADLRQMISDDPSRRGMATTLTFVDLADVAPIVAWIGDSRVYHIRNGVVMFATRDHSVVAELLERGEITESEVAAHPRKNVITRAVTGEPATEIAHTVLANVQPGDYILLCSDGVSACLDSQFIDQTFRSGIGIARISEAVDRHCALQSKDNYSMWLIEINGAPQRQKRRTSHGWFIGIIIALTLSALALFLVPRLAETEPREGVDPTEGTLDSAGGSVFTPPRSPGSAVDTAF